MSLAVLGHFVQIVEALGHDDGAEDLLAHHAHLRVHVGEDGRVYVIAAVGRGRIAAHHHSWRRRACRPRYSPSRARAAPWRRAGPCGLRGRGWHAGPRTRQCRPCPRATSSNTLLMRIQAAARDAYLARIEEDRLRDAGRGLRTRSTSGITTTGLLPPSSSVTCLSVSVALLVDQLADLSRAGEGHLVDIGVLDHPVTARCARSRSRC